MTSHYIDITVVPDSESSVPQLMGTLHDKLHMALVAQGCHDIGVSFPGYATHPRSIGGKLRLHGNETELEQLMQHDWLKGMRDHVRASAIALVPSNARHRSVSRKQFKTNVDRLRRRRMRRKGETAEQVAQAIPRTVERSPTLPYLRVRSRSTHQAFCLFIHMSPLSESAMLGDFSSYGLSTSTTIPWF